MTIALNPDVPVNVLEGVASGIQNSATYAIPSVGTQVEWQTVFGTPPASITVLIQTSIDGSNWNTAATTTVVDGSEGNFLTSAKFIRARIDAISGGANLTVILNAKKVTAQIITGSGVPGGTDGQVQFNDAGAFGGIAEGDAGDVLTSNGAGSPPSFEPASSGNNTRTIVCAIDGGGSPITTGIKCDVYVPVACTIIAATLLADQVGNIVIDIWADAFANYPPTDADSITAAAPPELNGEASSQDNTLTGWDTAIDAGTTLRFNVDSIADITRVQLTLTVEV